MENKSVIETATASLTYKRCKYSRCMCEQSEAIYILIKHMAHNEKTTVENLLNNIIQHAEQDESCEHEINGTCESCLTELRKALEELK